ncbi:chemotaxis protein CheX [Desulforamulus reducens]|nr:chemotaxis protein CheX [Desulforamulus reducens]
MTENTAKNIASVMMCGMSVEVFDEMANMVTANAAISLEGLGQEMDISPPTLIVGKNVVTRISSVKTLAAEISTEVGVIEVNIGLEI